MSASLRTLVAGGCLLAILLLLATHPAHAIDPATLPNPQLQARYIKLIHEFRCVECQNESLADSEVDIAGELRREIRDMLLAGKTDAQIRDFLVSRYSEFILYRPRYSARNAWLWLLPLVLLVLGGFIAARIVRARSGLVASDQEPVEDVFGDAPEAVDDPSRHAGAGTPR